MGRRVVLVAATGLIVIGSACSTTERLSVSTSSTTDSAPDPPPGSVGTEPPPSSESPAGDTLPGPADPRIQSARAELAAQSGVALDEVAVGRIEPVTWPSTALGCPALDESYESRAIAGYRLILVIGDQEMIFHGANAGGPPELCEYLD